MTADSVALLVLASADVEAHRRARRPGAAEIHGRLQTSVTCSVGFGRLAPLPSTGITPDSKYAF